MDTPFLVIFHNRLAGKNRKTDVLKRLRNFADQLDCEYELVVVQRPDQFEEQAKTAIQLAQQKSSAIAVSGGDGTLRTIAQMTAGKTIPLALIPTGTHNYFAREHQLPLNLNEALHLAVHGSPSEVPVQELNGKVFLLNASLGWHVRAIEFRKKFRRLFGRRKWVNFAASVFALFNRTQDLDLELSIDEQPLHTHSPSVFLGYNNHQLKDLRFPRRDADSCEKPSIAIIMKPSGWLGRAAMLAKTFFKGAHTAKNLQNYYFLKLRVRSPAKTLTVALDGELFEVSTPIEVHPSRLPIQLMK